jgi:hypothetical protein
MDPRAFDPFKDVLVIPICLLWEERGKVEGGLIKNAKVMLTFFGFDMFLEKEVVQVIQNLS